ncbi:hypothetical protein [Rhodococcus opacus]|uniref:hypothetical protein n=1 Tax=Rhodococcus opacus TaxID=37919 RepID=UPI001F58AF9C|nr:hypothetical protein [Rhodococcus opacus]UNN00275.1 hypothetical protein MOO23_32290 [Rhodococcus opacus]
MTSVSVGVVAPGYGSNGMGAKGVRLNFERSRLPILAAIVLTVAGCGSSGTKPSAVESASAYSVPNNIRFNYRWSADPGVDLYSRQATVIRAYVESYYLAIDANALSAAYPGFAEAVPQHKRADFDHPVDLTEGRYVGTQFQHLMWMTKTERGWFATICTGDYSVMEVGQDGKFYNVGSKYVNAETVEVIAPNDVAATSADSSGPERAPTINVFDGWTLAEHVKGARDQNAYAECDSACPMRGMRDRRRRTSRTTPPTRRLLRIRAGRATTRTDALFPPSAEGHCHRRRRPVISSTSASVFGGGVGE